jgi:hypothetical protein
MRRFLLAAAIALALGAAPVAADSGAFLRSFICHPSLDPTKRIVSVTAVMPTLPGTQKLEMRFQLESHTAGLLIAIKGGDLGHWITPHPITLGQAPGDVWIVNHPVTGVPVPANYHFKVTFRWIGAAGRVLSETTRTGLGCWQPDLRPDLLVRSITVQPVTGAPSENQYVAVIGNGGLTAATGIEVLFQPARSAPGQKLVTIPRLRPHTTRALTFTGPACTPATAPPLTVDPYNKIDDLNRANNTLTATCPSGPSTPS